MPGRIRIDITAFEARALQLAIHNYADGADPDPYVGAAIRVDRKVADALRAKNMPTWTGSQ